MEKLSVLIIGPVPPPTNGCSHANKVLIDNLRLRRHKVGTINTSVPSLSTSQGGVFSISKALRFSSMYLSVFKVFFWEVLYITPGQTFYGVVKYAPFILLGRAMGKPYIVHIHGNYLGQEYKRLKGVKKWIFHGLLCGASAGIVLSKSLLGNFKNILSEDRLHIVENFFSRELQSGSGIQKNAEMLRMLYLSNLMPEKGIFIFLDSLLLLKEKGVKFEASIAGLIEFGYEEEILRKIEALGDNVRYLGTVFGEEKKRLLVEANVFVLPTYYRMEGQPISILEGLSTGNIIVSTKHAGIPDVIDSKNGFLLSSKSFEELADCLQDISNNIEEYLLKFSAYNVEYASINFTEENFVDKIISVCYELPKSQTF